MKLSTVVPTVLVAMVSLSLAGCAVDTDDDDGTVVVPGKTDVNVTNPPDVNITNPPDVKVTTPAPDVNIKIEPPPSSNTTG